MPETADEPRPYWRRNLLKRFLADQKFAATQWWPAEGQRLTFTLPVLASMVAASRSSGNGWDLRLERSVAGWADREGLRPTASALTRLGDGETALALIGGTYLISRWTGHHRMAATTSLSAEALLNSALYSGLRKRATRRARPPGSTGQFFMQSPGLGQDIDSFPSGHAMGAFAVASVFASQYRHKRWVPWLAYGAAGLVSGSRVVLGRHFPSDVVAGAVLGRSLGKMVVTRSGEIEPRGASFRFEPSFDIEQRSVGLRYRRAW